MFSPPSYPYYDGLEQKSMLQVSSLLCGCLKSTEYDEDEADYVNCSLFWCKAIIMGGLSKNISDVPSVEPNLLQWSPFVGPKTYKGLMILNTEHIKVHQENGEIENDCHEVTIELHELLGQATPKEVTLFTKQPRYKTERFKAGLHYTDQKKY